MLSVEKPATASPVRSLGAPSPIALRLGKLATAMSMSCCAWSAAVPGSKRRGVSAPGTPTRSLTGTSRQPCFLQVAASVGTVQFMSAANTSRPPVATAISSLSQLPVRPTNTSSTAKRCSSSWPVSMEPTMRRPLAPAALALSCAAGLWAAAMRAAPIIGS